ncbi:MAG: hypothetical protein WC747_01970 [Candidatus Babeliales bacterium]
MKRTNFLSMLLFFAAAPALMLPAQPKAKAKATPTKTAQPSSCLNNPAVPYAEQLKAAVATLPKQQQQEIENLWCSLYAGYLAQSKAPATATPQAVASSPEIASAYKAIVQEQLFDRMLAYLNPKTFPKLLNDPQGTVHTNYATQHLRQALTRLASISKIVETKDAPQIEFTGDNRDLGIIVNIQNNTNAEFSISQTSLDGKTSVQIGQLNHGLNEVNLHTAALQSPVSSKKEATPQPSNFSFEITESGAENPINISIKMMSGVEFLTFLKTLPRDKKAIEKDTFEMNGLPTSPQYLASPKDWYLVLIQNPTPATAAERDPNQRVQAINISKLTGPYLLSMQINNEMITQNTSAYANKPSVTDVYQPSSTFLEWQVAATQKKLLEQAQQTINQPQQLNVYQPSFTLMQSLTNDKNILPALPMLILPQFLYNLPEMQASWMLMITSYLSVATKFEFFKKAKLGNTFEYFEQLGCFGVNNKYAFFIDLYNRYEPGYTLYNAFWLMSHAIYETDLKSCSDIPQLYTAQDSYGHFVVNEHNFYFINFLAIFTPKIDKVGNKNIFEKNGFNQTYAYPLNQLYSFVINALRDDTKEGIFATLHQPRAGAYQLTWRNKSNKILSSQYLYLDSQLANLQISFINQVENWIGSSVPAELIRLQPGKTTHFKVTYEFSPNNNKHILLAQPTSAIDKQQVFLPLQFTEFPIRELYINVFRELNIVPYTHCSIIKDGVLPTPLENLSVEDWRSGIYMVPGIENNDHLTLDKPGALTLLFYKANKTFLGEMTIPGLINNGPDTGIPHPASIYDVHLTKYNCQVYLYLSTGIFLQYNQAS